MSQRDQNKFQPFQHQHVPKSWIVRLLALRRRIWSRKYAKVLLFTRQLRWELSTWFIKDGIINTPLNHKLPHYHEAICYCYRSILHHNFRRCTFHHARRSQNGHSRKSWLCIRTTCWWNRCPCSVSEMVHFCVRACGWAYTPFQEEEGSMMVARAEFECQKERVICSRG